MIDGIILLPLFTSNQEYSQLVNDIRPSVIAVTKGDPHIEYKQQQANEVGAEVKEVVPLLEHFSSSSILKYAHILGD